MVPVTCRRCFPKSRKSNPIIPYLMDQAAVTIDIDLPPDVADEFKRQARAENISEDELFQRMFCLYRIAVQRLSPTEKRHFITYRDEQRLEALLLEGLASESRPFGPEEWKAFKTRVLASIEESNAGHA
jgi:hypothetical protein